MLLASMLLSVFAPRPAMAFCGTYVGSADAELFNSASQIAVVRQGTRTTLTLANDVQGNVADFALVVPVPEVLGPEDVRVVEPEIFGRLDGYSAPRLVSYTCDDFRNDYDSGAPASEDDTDGGGGGTDGSVTVEAQFTAGNYDIVILSAQESGALLSWLNDNGYSVSSDASDLLGEYIAAHSYFFAARVSLTLGQDGQVDGYLQPLQFGYDSEVFSLPIRIGTLNSPGAQDLLLYSITTGSDGEVRVSNYPQVTIEDDCMWDEASQGAFGDFYQAQYAAAVGDHGAAWAVEYSWSTAGCDPCAQEPLSDEELVMLGFTGDRWDSHITRIHARYSAEAAGEDLMLYTSGQGAAEQIRYIQYDQRLEDRYPICREGMADDPGSCDEVQEPGDSDPGDDNTPGDGLNKTEPLRSCSSAPASGGPGLLGLALLGLALRRRR